MITQTLAIFYDAYRRINARKMFWIVLALSLVVVIAMACVGFDADGLSILWWNLTSASEFSTQHMSAPAFYKFYLLQTIGIDIWLSWVACILAIISTAGIFPDFLSGGSIDLSLSKPIGRVRLFLTQYVAGLLFVTLQVAVFSVGSFLVIGFRADSWDPKILMAIPLVVCFFSYLFSVCALLGVVTKSTLASLLLTLLFWFLLWGLHSTESSFGTLAIMEGQRVEQLEQEIAESNALLVESQPATNRGEEDRDREHTREAPRSESQPATNRAAKDPDRRHVIEFDLTMEDQKERLARQKRELAAKRKTIEWMREAQDILVKVKTFLPKTTETVQLLQRVLVEANELPFEGNKGPEQRIVAEQRSRSVGWIVGTSLGFEAVILAIGAWFFRRRDF